MVHGLVIVSTATPSLCKKGRRSAPEGMDQFIRFTEGKENRREGEKRIIEGSDSKDKINREGDKRDRFHGFAHNREGLIMEG